LRGEESIVRTQEEVTEWLVSYLAKLLDIDPNEIDPSVPLVDYGIDSTGVAGLTADLGKWLGGKLKEGTAFDHPTVERLAAYLASQGLVSPGSAAAEGRR
jgi:acyl carrier protein